MNFVKSTFLVLFATLALVLTVAPANAASPTKAVDVKTQASSKGDYSYFKGSMTVNSSKRLIVTGKAGDRCGQTGNYSIRDGNDTVVFFDVYYKGRWKVASYKDGSECTSGALNASVNVSSADVRAARVRVCEYRNNKPVQCAASSALKF